MVIFNEVSVMISTKFLHFCEKKNNKENGISSTIQTGEHIYFSLVSFSKIILIIFCLYYFLRQCNVNVILPSSLFRNYYSYF